MSEQAQALINRLSARLAHFNRLLLTEQEPMFRAVYQGWADATAQALREVGEALTEMERERFGDEPQYGSLRDRLLAEEGITA